MLVGPHSCLSSCFPGGDLAAPAEAQQQPSGNSFCREGSVFNHFNTLGLRIASQMQIWWRGVSNMFGGAGFIFHPQVYIDGAPAVPAVAASLWNAHPNRGEEREGTLNSTKETIS